MVLQSSASKTGLWYNVTLQVGKEPELVREVGRYQLDIVGLSSMHSLRTYVRGPLREIFNSHFRQTADSYKGGSVILNTVYSGGGMLLISNG